MASAREEADTAGRPYGVTKDALYAFARAARVFLLPGASRSTAITSSTTCGREARSLTEAALGERERGREEALGERERGTPRLPFLRWAMRPAPVPSSYAREKQGHHTQSQCTQALVHTCTKIKLLISFKLEDTVLSVH